MGKKARDERSTKSGWTLQVTVSTLTLRESTLTLKEQGSHGKFVSRVMA